MKVSFETIATRTPNLCLASPRLLPPHCLQIRDGYHLLRWRQPPQNDQIQYGTRSFGCVSHEDTVKASLPDARLILLEKDGWNEDSYHCENHQ